MSASKKLKLYIGCAITEAPEQFSKDISILKDKLRAEGYEILDFIDLAIEATPAEVYRWDIERCIVNCDAFVAICDHPSTGLGFELGEAARLKKPVLLLAGKDVRITRLIRGAAEVLQNFRFESYDDIGDDTFNLVNRWLIKIGLAA